MLPVQHLAAVAAILFAPAAWAADEMATEIPVETPRENWYSGDYYLKIGGAGFFAPDYEGDDDYGIYGQPLISFGRVGPEQPFTSRNDNISLAIFDSGGIRAGLTGKLLFERDDERSDELDGLDPVRFGGEVGVFAEVYPTDWLRVRGEVRQGIETHDAIVGDIAADAFYDLTPAVRLSGGPRVSFAGSDYFDAYYGVNAEESVESGLDEYDPGSGFKSVGVGGAITWETTEALSTSLFGEYSRLVGPAADSSLVEDRGSENQFTVGVSATYRFDFSF